MGTTRAFFLAASPEKIPAVRMWEDICPDSVGIFDNPGTKYEDYRQDLEEVSRHYHDTVFRLIVVQDQESVVVLYARAGAVVLVPILLQGCEEFGIADCECVAFDAALMLPTPKEPPIPPCPNCGCASRVEEHPGSGYTVFCLSCEMRGPREDTVEEAVDTWGVIYNRMLPRECSFENQLVAALAVEPPRQNA